MVPAATEISTPAEKNSLELSRGTFAAAAVGEAHAVEALRGRAGRGRALEALHAEQITISLDDDAELQFYAVSCGCDDFREILGGETMSHRHAW